MPSWLRPLVRLALATAYERSRPSIASGVRTVRRANLYLLRIITRRLLLAFENETQGLSAVSVRLISTEDLDEQHPGIHH